MNQLKFVHPYGVQDAVVTGDIGYAAEYNTPIITANNLRCISVSKAQDGSFYVTLALTEYGAKSLYDYTKAHVGKKMRFDACGEVLNTPTIQSAVGLSGIITSKINGTIGLKRGLEFCLD